MTTVTCSRCGGTKEALETAPVPGALGESVVRHVCRECWGEWIETSIRVVNHYQLHPSSKEHRESLFGFMREFLKLPAE